MTTQNQLTEIFDILTEAQQVLEDLPMGGIGARGPSLEDIKSSERNGKPIEDDACFHNGQKAWLLLEKAKGMVEDTQ